MIRFMIGRSDGIIARSVARRPVTDEVNNK